MSKKLKFEAFLPLVNDYNTKMRDKELSDDDHKSLEEKRRALLTIRRHVSPGKDAPEGFGLNEEQVGEVISMLSDVETEKSIKFDELGLDEMASLHSGLATAIENMKPTVLELMEE